jgi:hypothetical protein
MSQNHLFKQQIGRPNDTHAITNQPATGLLSRADVARRLSVCVHTVARNKQLTPIKFNARLVRYRAEDLEKFIESAITGTGGVP